MRLGDLFPESVVPRELAQREVASVSADSRAVVQGTVFFALPGTKADGLAFAAEAARRGAAAIAAERAPDFSLGSTPFIKVADTHAAFAFAAARLYPRQPATIAAVTGTSGKTSVADFVRQIWAMQGFRAASLGTLGLVAPWGEVSGALTTPDPVALHQTLDEASARGVTHLAMEASSHGLLQRRLDAVRLSAGAFTNLSRDHLDYHATFEDYLAAKLLLFERLLKPGDTAIVDADSEAAPKIIAACDKRGLRLLTTGFRGSALRLTEARAEDFATQIAVSYEGNDYKLLLPLAGAFQASNALVAAALCIATGSAAEAVFAALENLKGAPGRMELAGRRHGAPIFVDYAHKPDALEKALKTLRPLVEGRLIAVFGCGGDRDAGKRPLMGEIAARLADHVIVTDDNPRSEDPALIRKAILAGAHGFRNLDEVGDRALAIARAIAMLNPGDGLLVAGKGHESGQIIGGETLPFSDLHCVRAILAELRP